MEIQNDIELKYSSLCNEIESHNKHYFNNSKPIISDFEFDKLFKELITIETMYPEIKSIRSPSNRIGSEPISEFKKIKHNASMMSIEKVYNHKDLLSFFTRISKDTKSQLVYEYKIDGLSLSLHYKDGYLDKAVTRGDGVEGEDVTENAKVINSIPLYLPGFEKSIEIRGEVYMSFETFRILNEKKEENKEQLLANPRNAASGALKRKDPKISKQSNLSFIAYDIINPEKYGITSQVTLEGVLSDLGFETPELKEINVDNYDFALTMAFDNKDKMHYPIDGIVIKLDDIEERNKFESTSSYPKWMMAYKFAEEIAETTVLDITVQVGKTGTLTPVAIFEPTELCGSIVQKASLHNFDMIRQLDIRVGDTVAIKKAGEIIPQVVSVVSTGEERGPKFTEPTECPICHSSVAREGDNVALMCTGSSCSAKIIGKVEYWASKDVMNIDGFGPAIVQQFYDAGYIHDRVSDIYYITLPQIESLDRMGKRSSEKLFKAIQDSIKQPFERVLCGLQIPNTGRTTSKLLANKFKNMNELRIVDYSDLIEIDGIGEIGASVISNWFKDSNNITLLEELENLGFNFEIVEEEPKDFLNMSTDYFNGKTVCVTGTLAMGSRNIAHEIVLGLGAKIHTKVSKDTNILIVGEKAGSKLDKATKLGIVILTEDGFLKLVS
jgi:DNA ligase (NAD+)